MIPVPRSTQRRRLTPSGWLVAALLASVVVAIGALLALDRTRQHAAPVVSSDPMVLEAHQSYVNGKALYAKAMELPPGDARVELFRQAQGFFATARDAYRELVAAHPQDASLALHEQEAKEFLATCRNDQVFIGK
jgi:hypothetical protein